MIKVIINGANGRMGKEALKAIEDDPALSVVAKCDRSDNLAQTIKKTGADVVVDLTSASAGFENAKTIITSGACPVIGTSGFQISQVEQLQRLAKEKKVGGVIAPNFSIGAVLMLSFSQQAAKYFADVEVVEAHSIQKEESPSGTAIRTAEMIASSRGKAGLASNSTELIQGARGATVGGVHLHSIRLPGVVAQQTVFFGGEDRRRP